MFFFRKFLWLQNRLVGHFWHHFVVVLTSSPACYAPWEQSRRDPSQAVFTHTAPSLGLAQRDMEGQLGKYGAIFTVARFTTPSSDMIEGTKPFNFPQFLF